MTQKERLVQLIIDSVNGCARNWAEVIADHLLANGVLVIDADVVSMKNRPLISSVASLPIDEVIDLVKAKEEGRLIVPPCKVGDTVYVLDVLSDNCKCADCDYYYAGGMGDSPECERTSHGYRYHKCIEIIEERAIMQSILCWLSFGSFGKTVFLTREEAEKALAERSKE